MVASKSDFINPSPNGGLQHPKNFYYELNVWLQVNLLFLTPTGRGGLQHPKTS